MPNRLTKSYKVEDWNNLRSKLSNSTLLTEEWNIVITILKERIFERYFAPLKLLIKDSKGKGEGFTILTLECTLIEFLATLEDGRIFKRDTNENLSPYYYKKSAKIYQQFLKRASIFKSFFWTDDKKKPLFSPYDFYVNVRCALVHEAQTRSSWEVKIYKNLLMDVLNTICFEQASDGKKIIYRTALLKSLEKYFLEFINLDLKQNNNRGKTLRKHLARKIDHIAEISPDERFWWH